MNGIHDMGGMQDMGPIQREENEPVFHQPWEGRVFAMNRALGAWGKWNIDAGRYGIELLPPADYLRMSYYEKWLARNLELLVKSGLVTREEMETSKPAPGSQKATPPLTAAAVIRRGRAPRQFYATGSGRQGSLRSGTAGPRPEYESGGPHSLAAICERQKGRCRPLPRHLRIPGYKRAFSGRATAALVFGSFYGAGVVGRGRLAARFCFHGYVG